MVNSLSFRSKKRNYLKNTDHRLDIGPAGRNIFISRDKQAQNKSAKRIKLMMRLVIGLVIAAITAAVALFVWFYLVPFFHSEFNIGASSSASSEESHLSSEDAVEIPVYDSMGLQVYPDDISLFVINETNPAPEDFVPELGQVGDIQVDARISDAVRLMMTAAKNDGLVLSFSEGYVSYGEQEKRFEAKTRELMEGPDGLTTVMAKTEARTTAPMAGESDFQTGLCLRLNYSGDAESFTTSQTYSWLRSNMGKYGFVFRYPSGKEDYTGLEADPTVIRYVGSEHAAGMQQRSMCLEEYISNLNKQ